MKTLAIIITAFLLTLPGFADAFRCGGSIVDIGDTKAEVLAKCGEPSLTEEKEVEIAAVRKSPRRRRRERAGASATATINVEEWTYNFGSNRFMQILTFVDSELTKIETGDYGFDE
jgi:hypothetical protein